MPPSVIFVSSEAAPFSKTGGLADVAGSLPLSLRRLGLDCALFLPYYRESARMGLRMEQTGLAVTVPMGGREVRGEVLLTVHRGLPVYFIRRDEYFDRAGLYGTPEGDYFDNLDRFAFFSRAVIETLKSREFAPDIIHCNDWQTGLIPAYLKDVYKNDLSFSGASTVFTVHNIAYQGLFDSTLFGLTGLSPGVFSPGGAEFWGKVSLLKAGLVYSDVITTVSPTYSREIQTPEYGGGLDGVLALRRGSLHGVLNGVDYGEWDPANDPLIPANYSAEDMRGKAVCKKALLKAFGLELGAGRPLIGMVTRLAAQKGFDILADAAPEIIRLGAGLVILGSGERKYASLLEDLAARHPDGLSFKAAFDNALAHLVEAGSDIFLMPSRYEPCGLNQIYSLKYGTVPVVRATGGLDDTVRQYGSNAGTGFKFEEYSAEALIRAVEAALKAFKDKKAWKSLQAAGMKEDFSWDASAREYAALYEQACAARRRPAKGPLPGTA